MESITLSIVAINTYSHNCPLPIIGNLPNLIIMEWPPHAPCVMEVGKTAWAIDVASTGRITMTCGGIFIRGRTTSLKLMYDGFPLHTQSQRGVY